jgi:hypothetical protein
MLSLAADEIPVLVVVVNDPTDLARARDEGWYRIPLAHAPRRIAAEYLAFYHTGAFPPDERWAVHWMAPVRSYHIATRRELIPQDADHPRADNRYYRIMVGPLQALSRPIPSRRLRRITFISTTMDRLLAAEEINDLWVKSTAQERLWAALKQADIEAERQYPLREDLPQHVADFAVICHTGAVALIVEDEPRADDELHEPLSSDYILAAKSWTPIRVRMAELEADPQHWVACIQAKIADLGGSVFHTNVILKGICE